MKNTYVYETFPGQTIVRQTNGSGYTPLQLQRELFLNGDGIVVLDENADRSNGFLVGIEGRSVKEFEACFDTD